MSWMQVINSHHAFWLRLTIDSEPDGIWNGNENSSRGNYGQSEFIRTKAKDALKDKFERVSSILQDDAVNPGKPGWTSMSTWLLNLEWCFFYTITADGKKPMPRCIFVRVSGFKTSVPYFSLLINIWWGGVKVKCTTLCDISEKGHVIKVGPLLYFESQNH